MAENLILTGPDGTEYTFPGVSKVSIRKSGGGRAEYGSGGGGSNATLIGLLDGSLTRITAQELDGLVYLKNSAFADLWNMAYVELPDTVEEIGDYAFANTGMTTLILHSVVPPTIFEDTFTLAPINTQIYVPAASVSAYQMAQYWSARAAYIQAIP